MCEWAVFILDNIEEKGGHDEISNGYFIANQELCEDTLCLELFLADYEELTEDAISDLDNFLALFLVVKILSEQNLAH